MSNRLVEIVLFACTAAVLLLVLYTLYRTHKVNRDMESIAAD
jgi:hypothetical protein